MGRSEVFGGLTWNYVTLSFPGWPWKRQTQKRGRAKKKTKKNRKKERGERRT